MTTHSSRRSFLGKATLGALGVAGCLDRLQLLAQAPGERPSQDPDIQVLNPCNRVPVGIIIDDSTCLVNLNRFTMPQFDLAFDGANQAYHKPWREWPAEIPDGFIRKFAEWSAAHGVKGKFSIVPYPACVGRLDRFLPGWSQRDLAESLELIRSAMMPHYDIHPEMVTHTRVIDLKTGQPYPDHSLAFMENWDWTKGRSADELAAYVAYALDILKNAGLKCEGVTSPGGFGAGALPEYSRGVGEAVRTVFKVEIPHYFREVIDHGTESPAPRIEHAAHLDGPDPRCVVSIVACTGDWTGGWDCVKPEGADRFITPDLQRGRMVEVIQRGEPALMLAHWTGVYWNGQELGFKIFQEVVQRLQARFDNLIWMKLCELARYWAAKTLTRIERQGDTVLLRAPFASPDFTISIPARDGAVPALATTGAQAPLAEAANAGQLRSGTWIRQGRKMIVCFDLRKGMNRLACPA